MFCFYFLTMFDVISSTELEKTKKDLAALKEQAAGLTREYDRLLEEHSKAQVGIFFFQPCSRGSYLEENHPPHTQ